MKSRFQQAFWRRAADGDLVRLFALMPEVSFFAKDRRGRFVALNRLGCEFCGVADEAAALGKTDHDFFPRRRADEYVRDDRAVMQADLPIVNRIESAPEQEGSPRLVMTTKIPLHDAAGNVIGVAGVSRRVDQMRVRPAAVAPLADVIEQMHTRFGEQLSSRHWAQVAGMSVSHFERVFRRTFDASPRQYFLRVRIEGACRRLAETNDSVAAVAASCGFHDHAHLTRSFRKLMATTPSAYRAARQSPGTAVRPESPARSSRERR